MTKYKTIVAQALDALITELNTASREGWHLHSWHYIPAETVDQYEAILVKTTQQAPTGGETLLNASG